MADDEAGSGSNESPPCSGRGGGALTRAGEAKAAPWGGGGSSVGDVTLPLRSSMVDVRGR